MSKVSRLEVVATGARRRWTLAEKQRIVAESFIAPRNTSATARRHALSTSQLFTWRRLAREGRLAASGEAAAFVPAVVAREHGAPDVPSRMEIVLPGSRRVIVGGDVDAAALARVLEVLEQR
jgi:transposase